MVKIRCHHVWNIFQKYMALCYDKIRKSDGAIKFRCLGCKDKRASRKKNTYAIAKLVGKDPLTGQPIHELLEKDDVHTCIATQNTKWLNKVFLNRCYRAIRDEPLVSVVKIYDDILQAMKLEFFSQDPADAETTEALQLEFEQNIRSFRNIQKDLYKYRWQFVPKCPPVSNFWSPLEM